MCRTGYGPGFIDQLDLAQHFPLRVQVPQSMDVKDSPPDGSVCAHCGGEAEAERRERLLVNSRLAELEAENAQLRNAAITFGDLAERLNRQLRHEPRSSTDRRRPQA